MNYYIQGDAANADQINAAFKKLGYDTSGHLFNANSVLYFTLDGEIRATTCNCTPAIIKTHPDYKELELAVKSKFKVGDWIVRNNGSSDIPIQVYGLKKDRYLVTNMLGSKGQLMINRQDEWRLWEITDAKDGDVICTPNNNLFIYKCKGSGVQIYDYCGLYHGKFEPDSSSPNGAYNSCDGYIPATKEQRDLLFAKMKEAGYEWDADKKELRKIQPHYDIANFKPFDKVLVRCSNDEEWMIEFYCKYDTLVHTSPHRDYSFMGIGDSYSQCIPYNDDTKHLLGTTDMPSEEYINW